MENRKMMMLCLLLAAISSPVFTGEWKASVAKSLDALVKSCVVIPCSYTHAIDELPHSRLRGIWHLSTEKEQCVYHDDQTMILENFRGRTKLLGNLSQGNCTLEMIEIKDHDNGPFCFRVELVTGTKTSETEKFSFVDSCVNFKMITEPPKPTLIPPKTAIQDHPYTIACSVIHTCPSHVPQLTWSRGTAEEIIEVHREIHQGTWESQSNLTFITEEKDDHTDITCTAEFFGGTTSTEKLTLYVKPISSPVFTGEWKASVAKNLDALVTSCVVIPCSFTHAKDELPHSRLRGIWHLSTDRDQRIYHEDQTMILENIRSRTKLLGNLGQGNCALEIIEIKDHDNGPFCFRVELVTNGTETSKTDKFSFVDSCVNFKMITEPPKPTLIPPKTAIQGHAYTITCSVIHTCPSHIPQLTWSRGTAEEILEVHREIHQGTWEAQSNLTFNTEEKDNHTDITCTAEFFGGRTSTETLTLHVKPISPVFTGEWKASVAKSLDALVTSCVVIPCSYTHAIDELPHSRLRGIWHLSTEKEQCVYHDDQTMILENYRGHTKLLGNLGQGNCTLEIIEIKDHDNGPFCFRVELVTNGTETSKTDKFSFVESCVNFKMITEPPKPTLISPKTAIQDHPYTITCSVIHTCPSHIPQLTWSRGTAEEILEVHREIHQGTWETQSNLTFITEEKDDHTDITCTAEFFGGRTSTEKLTLHVKREIGHIEGTENHNHIIIPVVVGISTTVIFGGLCIFIWKKYK